jgi:hypothetical protein
VTLPKASILSRRTRWSVAAGRPDGRALMRALKAARGSEAAKCAVWPPAVVVVAKRVELELQLSQGLGSGLLAEEALECLVKALDLAAGLGMVRSRVFDLDAVTLELQFEQDFAAAGSTCEAGSVVA